VPEQRFILQNESSIAFGQDTASEGNLMETRLMKVLPSFPIGDKNMNFAHL